MVKRSLLILIPLLVIACPKKEDFFKKLTKMGLPVKEIERVAPSKRFEGLCEVVAVIRKDKRTFQTKFYLTEDGKYLIPFIGKLETVPSKVLKGWKEIHIRSLRNPKHQWNIGLIDKSGKYFIPELFEVK